MHRLCILLCLNCINVVNYFNYLLCLNYNYMYANVLNYILLSSCNKMGFEKRAPKETDKYDLTPHVSSAFSVSPTLTSHTHECRSDSKRVVFAWYNVSQLSLTTCVT